ncbi:DNA-binding NarL/FixJ family response regulator [Catenulispora sp. MAP12-49]|uniref:helix-turn-helix domain-containing protein n=1 Tax=unclassified Catenulispora TaxID=414885 RepID=UPI003515741E
MSAIGGVMRQDKGWLPGPDARPTRALALLITGLTDDAVARRLAVSRRTVQRAVRDLMDAAGARTRMQLGHHAACVGLPIPDLPSAVEPRDQPVQPAPADLRLLALLLEDARVDRVLGVSPRSVEREVRRLMTLAGAKSRVQLGWLATRWGWL